MTSAVEKKRVIEICRTTVSGDCLLVAGINAENSIDAANQAMDVGRAVQMPI